MWCKWEPWEDPWVVLGSIYLTRTPLISMMLALVLWAEYRDQHLLESSSSCRSVPDSLWRHVARRPADVVKRSWSLFVCLFVSGSFLGVLEFFDKESFFASPELDWCVYTVCTSYWVLRKKDLVFCVHLLIKATI